MNAYSDDNYQHTQFKSGDCSYKLSIGRKTQCPKCEYGDLYLFNDAEHSKCLECGHISDDVENVIKLS